MATRSMNTMAEAMSSLMSLISEMKMMPDSKPHLDWLIGLETQIIQKADELRNPGAAMPPGGGPPAMAGPGLGPTPPPVIGPGPARTGNVTPGPTPPNPDELRRLMS